MHRDRGHEIGIVTNRAPPHRYPLICRRAHPSPSPHIRTDPRIFGELSLPETLDDTPVHACTSIRGRPWNLISLIVSVVCPTALSLPFSITWLGNSESVGKEGERGACASFVARPLVFEKEEKNFFFFHVSLLSWKEIFGDFRR